MKINGLDLFSGIGGIGLALKPWVRTVAYCEQDIYAQGVLLSRMRDGQCDRAPIWDDVRTLTAALLPEIDIISGGFPCQDISIAGNGEGLGGKRSGLFFEIIRLVSELRPRFVFLENVPAITIRGLERILLEFTSLGYDCRWSIVSAAEVGACHVRERWWLCAHANSDGLQEKLLQAAGWVENLRTTDACKDGESLGSSERLAKPRVGRTGDGVSNWVDRIRCQGNSVVPQTAREAFKKLAGLQ